MSDAMREKIALVIRPEGVARNRVVKATAALRVALSKGDAQ